jgi:hypothetical protein
VRRTIRCHWVAPSPPKRLFEGGPIPSSVASSL